MLSMQWFVNMKPLAHPAIKAVKDGEVRFIPERFEKTYFNWMENIKDWCISRQLWWGAPHTRLLLRGLRAYGCGQACAARLQKMRRHPF